MNKAQIFRTAHTTAKATRKNFTSYRAAFAAALKSAYNPAATIESVSQMTFESVSLAAENIKSISGIIYHGKIEDRRGRKNYNVYSLNNVDYHVSYSVNRDSSVSPSFQDVTDKI